MQKNKRSCSALSALTGAVDKGEGSRPHDFEWSQETEQDWSSALYLFIRSPQGLSYKSGAD